MELKTRLQRLEENNEPQDQEKIDGIRAALRLIEEDLKETTDTVDGLDNKRQISYEYLWTLFRRGTYVYAYDNATDQPYIARAKKFSYQQQDPGIKFALIECDILAHDNLGFGRAEADLYIPAFTGTSPITDLSIYPFKYHKEHDTLYQTAVARGKRYAVMRLHFCQHQGAATLARGLKLRVSIYDDFGPPHT